MPASTPSVLWTTPQCAAHLGISETTWRRYAADPRATGAPVPVTPAHATTPYWDAEAVKDYAVRRAEELRSAAEDRKRRLTVDAEERKARETERQARRETERQAREAERQARRAAREARRAAQETERQARLQSLQDDRQDRFSVRINPDTTYWTASQCATYHGIATHDWRLAVRNGDAPAPATSRGTQPLWSADAVRAVTHFG
ncbi:hypothetical protein [Streptomyces sp. NPDC008092]|uniref:hypothetical protein n=1 Tax=Streptomyces sp. NPDC008092 TaxID=3364808 RepID=UPI0036E4F5C7